MSLLDRIAECRAHDLRRFLPLRIGGERYGWVRREAAPLLGGLSTAFRVGGAHVDLVEGDEFLSRSEAVGKVVPHLRREGWVGPDRREEYPVVRSFGEEPLLKVDRSALPFFGFRAWGVHLNGFVRSPSGIRLWVAKRARDRLQSPGKLDHLVAGGQPLGLGFEENLAKECAEEAGVPTDLARRAVRVGEFSYRCEVPQGLRDDTLVTYDLELPASFEPENRDGEVESFALWPPERVAETLRESRDFKYNVAPVVIGFLLRHGFLDPEEPGFEALQEAIEPLPQERP